MPWVRQLEIRTLADRGETVEVKGIGLLSQDFGKGQYLADVLVGECEHDHGRYLESLQDLQERHYAVKMSGTANAVVVLPETFQAHLVESRHLDRDQLRDPFLPNGVAEDRRGKAPFSCRAVDPGELGVEEGVASRKGDCSGDVSILAKRVQVVEDAHGLVERHLGTAAPVITVLTVQVAGLCYMPLEREGRRRQVLFGYAVSVAGEGGVPADARGRHEHETAGSGAEESGIYCSHGQLALGRHVPGWYVLHDHLEYEEAFVVSRHCGRAAGARVVPQEHAFSRPLRMDGGKFPVGIKERGKILPGKLNEPEGGVDAGLAHLLRDGFPALPDNGGGLLEAGEIRQKFRHPIPTGAREHSR